MTKLTRQFTAWIACFAILLAALAPSISHAIAAGKDAGAGWIEVCSATGSKLVQVGGEHNPAPSEPAEEGLHFEHCPFCLTHGGLVGLPPSAGFTLPAVSGTQPLPSLYYQSPRPLFIWAAAQSRAPPAIS